MHLVYISLILAKSLVFGVGSQTYTYYSTVSYQLGQNWINLLMSLGFDNCSLIKTRSSWLNCALRDHEAVYWVSKGHYEAVAVGNWWYWVSMPLYIAQSGDLDRCHGSLTHWLKCNAIKGWANDSLLAGSKIGHSATVTVWSPARTLLLTSHYRTGGRQGQFSVESTGKTLFDHSYISLLKLYLCLQRK